MKKYITDKKDAVGIDILKHITRIRQQLDEAERYLANGRCPNGLGVLQSTGLRLEQLVAQYDLLNDLTKIDKE